MAGTTTLPVLDADRRVDAEAAELERALRAAVAGDVRFDRLSRTLYSTDASMYEIVPMGVVLPRTAADVAATVRVCRQRGVPIIPRGAGTGLAGGAVGSGVHIDCSRYMTTIGPIDAAARTVRVEAGVVLDELNATLAPSGLFFAPDVATSSRATIGGMIANNSCGAHSVVYGRTVDHLIDVTVVLSDGSLVTWGRGRVAGGDGAGPLERSVVGELERIRSDYAEEIRRRYPKILRRNGGYGLDRLVDAHGPINPALIVAGSEGTLCSIVSATLKLTPIPAHRGLLVVQFDQLLDALAATPAILEHGPSAVELADRLVLQAARKQSGVVPQWMGGDPAALLIVEFLGDAPSNIADRLRRLEADLRGRSFGQHWITITDPSEQARVWTTRTRGLGLLMSRPGDRQPYGFVEDTAVDPRRLRDYIARFIAILREQGVTDIAFFAHASVGCLHVRPVLNLKQAADIERMRRIGERISDLALEFGGSMTAEHGDGIVRSCWIEKMFGPPLARAFAEVKAAFDPDGILNPGKIVDPLPMTENLRYGASFHSRAVKTTLDFSAYGGLGGMVQMCSGIGQCRQRLVGTMCPSYMATRDETHTTRARANALRVALSDRGLLDGLADPALAEVMDVCLSCKACKTECPTGVDMAAVKMEWLDHLNRRFGAPARARLIARTPELARWGSRLAPMSNWITAVPAMRAYMERRFGLDRRVPAPRFARQTFRRWFRRHVRSGRAGGQNNDAAKVVFFVDTWMNYYLPSIGIAVVRLLEAAGYCVLCPHVQCCGRPMMSKGLLSEAVQLARMNVAALAPFVHRGIPIVGAEPSCILSFVDEYPRLVRSGDATLAAANAFTIETFLARVLRECPDAIRFNDRRRRILYHGHCHHKALVGAADANAILNAPPGYEAVEIKSGCCGMAGSFGHEVEHYDVARAVGEQRLFPAVRARGDAEIAVSGFSCRHQIEHHTGARPRHVAELLADALVD